MAPRRPSTNPPNPSVTDSPGRPSRAAKDKVINEKPWFTELQKRKRAQSTASSTPAESSTAKPAAKKAKNTKQKEERAARQFIARGLDDPAEASQLSAVAPPPPTNGAARNAFSDISTTRENALTTQKMRPAGKSRGNGPKQPADKSIMHAPRMDEHRTIVAPLNTQSSRSGVDEHGTIARNLAGHSLDSRNTSLSHHASTQEASPAPRMDEHRMTGNPTSTLSARRDIDGHGAVARNLAGHSLDAREPPIPRRASAREGLPAPRMDEHRTIGAPLGTQSARRDIDEHGTAARNLAGCTPETREPTLPHRASARDGLAAPRMDEHRTIVAPLNTQPARSDINEHGATLSGESQIDTEFFSGVHGPSLSRHASAQDVIGAISTHPRTTVNSTNERRSQPPPRRVDIRKKASARVAVTEGSGDEDKDEGKDRDEDADTEDASDSRSTGGEDEQMVVTAGEFAQETAFLPDSDSGGSEDTDPPARKVCSRRTPPVAVDDDDDLWSDNGSIVLSRRQEKQIAELPIFQEHGDYSDANDEASDDAPPAAAIAQDMDLSELAWPESARLVQRTTFRVKPQNEHIQKVVLTAKEALAKHIQLATPFPTAEQKDKIAIEVLTEAALVNHEGDIHHRLTEDDDFLVALAKLIRNHMNKVRNVVLTDGIKTIVKNEYAISDKRETATIQINALLRNHAYVHADHNNQSPKTLFTAPAIKILATKSLFMKDGCTHDRFPECFKSGVHPSQNEIPGPVIALISTAIFYVLSDYHRAANHFAPDFSAPRCIHAYGEHMKSLARMYAASKVKYHKVLHALYKDAVENSSGIVHNDDCYADELDGWSCYSDGDGDDGDGCE